jgi:hypothetical protein
MLTPRARGPLSEAVFAALVACDVEDPTPFPAALERLARNDVVDEPAARADEQICLWVLHELHYRGFDDVPETLEWHPGLLALRHRLEDRLEHLLRQRFEAAPMPKPEAFDAEALFSYVESHEGRSLSTYVRRDADSEEVLELLRWRSVYHLKETDPSAWAVPRLPRAAQAALVELMYDEYGAGRPSDVHSLLFARAMKACGLDERYGAYVDDVPVEILEQNNAMTLFGLHRRLVGAAMGHLAAFEMTSSQPSRRLAQGLERLGLPAEAVGYYTEHVEADSVHEQLAARGICAALVDAEPHRADDVYFGAFTCLDLEDRVAGAALESWSVAA